MEFLVRFMPTDDLQTLSAEFLLENVAYAYLAWHEAPWHNQIPEEVFLNDILPYANINERRDRWRKDFYERFKAIVADVPSPGVAAARLNQKLFPLVNVKYSTRRPKADQSPYESIDAGLASCTGLSILLIDACRAVGVPAQFVGIPMWSDRSGNHSWVEVWDQGWHFTGAAEATGDQLDKAWFVDRAATAQRDVPRHAIYAVSFRPTPLRFPLIWDRSIDYVRAVNVTDRYLGLGQELPVGQTPIMVRVIDATSHDRCAANFRVRDASGQIVFQGQTKDERFDANDHVTVPLPKDQVFEIEVVHDERISRTRIDTTEPQPLVTIRVQDAQIPTSDGGAEEAQSELQEPTAASKAAVEALDDFLHSSTPDNRPAIADQRFAQVPLTHADVQVASELLWRDHAARIRQIRRQEIQQRELVYGQWHMRFDYKTFGEKPADGRSLFISLHGGGNTSPRVNDRQWENQKTLYEPAEGIYLSPRAPTDTWNLWHQAHIDPLFDRLIEDLIVLEDVDPNRVYVMGYSAGGDGVFQLAPRMADRFAAAAMMAGHPNETLPLGLRNLPFTLHMGEKDAAYNRNQVAADWGEKLDALEQADPQGYVHLVKIHEGKGHWMDHEDAEALDWMARFRRNPFPEKVVWQQDDVTHHRFYWLAVSPEQAIARALLTAQRSGQRIEVESHQTADVKIRANDTMLDLDQPVEIWANGQRVFEGVLPRTIATLATTLAERGDPKSLYCAEATVACP